MSDYESDSQESEVVNPYTRAGRKAKSLMTLSQASRLPDANQATPLGSGIITGTLGEGGMARVYRVWNQKLEVYRAVKVLLPTESTELMGRFETEIKISAKLHHPNIVETYVVGDWNGLPFIEMELVDGISLEDLIAENGKIPQVVCVAIGLQVASALAYAHTEQFLIYGKMYTGIIHRDLKPANIMIGKNGVSKLMDFGIARPSEVGLHTVDGGGIFGTLPYLSPEQLDEGEIDQRSDIFSNLMRMKVFHSYKKFDAFSIVVDPALDKAIEKCLYQEKDRRFATSKEFELTLREIFEKLSSDTPEAVIKKYIENPSSFEILDRIDKIGGEVRRPFPLLKTIIAATIAGFIAVVLIMVSFRKPHTSATKDKYTEVVKKPDSVQMVIKTSDTATVSKPDPIAPSLKTGTADSVQSAKSKQQLSTVKAERKPVTIRTAPIAPAPEPEPEPVLSPVEVLGKKYDKVDIVEIAEAASKAGNWNDVITAVSNMPEDAPQKLKGRMLLAWAYVEQGNGDQADQILGSISSDDAFYVLLQGRIAYMQGKDKLALNKYEISLTRPSNVRDIQLVRNDALYYAAIAYDDRYHTTRTPEARQQAMLAWNALKRVYTSRPDHSRFLLANEKLSSF
jgi:serine/threonine protein kinase